MVVTERRKRRDWDDIDKNRVLIEAKRIHAREPELSVRQLVIRAQQVLPAELQRQITTVGESYDWFRLGLGVEPLEPRADVPKGRTTFDPTFPPAAEVPFREERTRVRWNEAEKALILQQAGRLAVEYPRKIPLELIRVAQGILPPERRRDLGGLAGHGFEWFIDNLAAATEIAREEGIPPALVTDTPETDDPAPEPVPAPAATADPELGPGWIVQAVASPPATVDLPIPVQAPVQAPPRAGLAWTGALQAEALSTLDMVFETLQRLEAKLASLPDLAALERRLVALEGTTAREQRKLFMLLAGGWKVVPVNMQVEEPVQPVHQANGTPNGAPVKRLPRVVILSVDAGGTQQGIRKELQGRVARLEFWDPPRTPAPFYAFDYVICTKWTKLAYVEQMKQALPAGKMRTAPGNAQAIAQFIRELPEPPPE